MSTNNHTPGPWKTRKGFSSDTIEIFAPNPKIKKPFRPCELATVEVESEEGKSNARLIAAAPDLLEALEVLLQSEVDRRWGISGGETTPMALARAAIARATGKEVA